MEGSLNILLIEDDPAIVKLITEELRLELGSWTYLECASRLSAACESLVAGEFDAIVADLSVSNGSMSALTSTLRSFAPETPLFVILDEAQEDLARDAGKMGVDACFFKHEIHNRNWLERVSKSVEHRRAALRTSDN